MTLRRSERAMTLLEVTIVLGLSVLLLGLALKMMGDVGAVWDYQHEQTESARQAWQLITKMGDELRAALDPATAGPGAAFEGEDGVTNLLAALPEERDLDKEATDHRAETAIHTDLLRFPTARVSPEHGEARPGMVQYRLERDKDGRILGIEKRSAVEGTTLAEGAASIISTRTRSLSFEYLNAADEWVARWTDTATLPRAVRIEVGNEGPMGPYKTPLIVRFMTTVNLPTGTRIDK